VTKRTTVKCTYDFCDRGGEVSVDERITEIIVSSTGKKMYKHFHPECHTAYLKYKELRKNDAPELDSLYKTIQRIHSIPKETNAVEAIMSHIQDVRNGTIRKGSIIIKRYKEGVPYSVIEDAYKISEPTIMYYRNGAKEFKDKKAELKYCFAIVLKNIDLAYVRRAKEKREAQLRQELEANTENIETVIHDQTTPQPTFKPKQNSKFDISDLLG
jgi:hypothetical protein